MRSAFFAVALSLFAVAFSATARGSDEWSAGAPDVVADVAAGRPFVVQVTVPLCDNGDIDCGSRVAGNPEDPDRNLYWGAVFGARRHFDRARSGWESVSRGPGPGFVLERIVYRRWVPPKRWGVERPVEQLAVLDAVDGRAILSAGATFWRTASFGGVVSFRDGDSRRTRRVHVAGYAGHNALGPALGRARLMDAPAGAAPIASFALGCQTDAYVRGPLAQMGSLAVLTTRTNMAPEGYVVDAVVKALGDNASVRRVRAMAVAAYARYQRIDRRAAGWTFISSGLTPSDAVQR